MARTPGHKHHTVWLDPELPATFDLLASWTGHRDRLARHGRLWVQDDLTYFRTSTVDWL